MTVGICFQLFNLGFLLVCDWFATIEKESRLGFGASQGWVCSTWLREASTIAPGEGERQAGGEETSLLVPSSPDSSVTGERSVWQRPAVI